MIYSNAPVHLNDDYFFIQVLISSYGLIYGFIIYESLRFEFRRKISFLFFINPNIFDSYFFI